MAKRFFICIGCELIVMLLIIHALNYWMDYFNYAEITITILAVLGIFLGMTYMNESIRPQKPKSEDVLSHMGLLIFLFFCMNAVYFIFK